MECPTVHIAPRNQSDRFSTIGFTFGANSDVKCNPWFAVYLMAIRKSGLSSTTTSSPRKTTGIVTGTGSCLLSVITTT